MKTRLLSMTCALALASAASLVHAEEKRNAVSLFGNLTSSKDVSGINVNLGYERFVFDKTSFLVNLSQNSTDTNGSESGTTMISLGVTQYFGEPMQGGNMLFYGKAIFSALRSTSTGPFGDTTTNGNGFGAFIGLEQPFSENSSLFEELGYQRYKYDSISLNQTVLNIGLKLRF